MATPPSLLLPGGGGAMDMDGSSSAFSPMAGVGSATPASRRAFQSFGQSPSVAGSGTDDRPGVQGPSANAAFPPPSLTQPDSTRAAFAGGDAVVGVAPSKPLRHYIINESDSVVGGNVGDGTLPFARELRIAVALPKIAAADRVRQDAKLVAPLARWSSLEDRLLLAADGKGANPVAEYASARARAPELFPKPVVHPDLIPRDGDPLSRTGKALNRKNVEAVLAEDSPAAAAAEKVRSAALAWHAAVETRVRELQSARHRPRNKMLLQLSVDDLEAVWRRCGDAGLAAAHQAGGSPTASTEASPERAGLAGEGPAMALAATSSIFTATNDLVLRGITRRQARRADEDLALEGKAPKDPHEDYPLGVGDEVECSSIFVCAQARYVKARVAAVREVNERARAQRVIEGTASDGGPKNVRRVPGTRAHRTASTVNRGDMHSTSAANHDGGGPSYGGAMRVDLCEAEPMYQNFPDMDDVFAIDNLRRFTAFCETPGLYEEREEKAAALAAAEAHARRVHDRLRRGASEDQAAHREEITAARDAALAALDAQIDAWFERDVAALRKAYSAHRHVERRNLSQAFTEAEAAADRFFAAEAQVCTELLGGSGASGISSELAASVTTAMSSDGVSSGPGIAGQRAALMALDRRMADVLPKYGVPRLLLLSELLVVPNLKDTCSRIIAHDLPHFVNDACLASPVIPESTLRAITNQCPLNTLVAARSLLRETTKRRAGTGGDGESGAADSSEPIALSTSAPKSGGRGNAGFPMEFVDAEYKRRRADALAAYRKMPVATLQRLCDPVQRAAYLAAYHSDGEDDDDDDDPADSPSTGGGRNVPTAVTRSRPPLFTDADTLEVCNDLLWQARADADQTAGRDRGHLDAASDAGTDDGTHHHADEHDAAAPCVAGPRLALASAVHAVLGTAQEHHLHADGSAAATATSAVSILLGCAVSPPPAGVAAGGGSKSKQLGLEVLKATPTSFAGAVVSASRRRVILRQPDVEFAVMPAVVHTRRHELASRRCGTCSLRYVFDCQLTAIDRACDLAAHVQIGLLVPPRRSEQGAAGAPGAAMVAPGADESAFAIADIASGGSVLWTRDGILLLDGMPYPFPVPAAAAFAAGDHIAVAVDETTGDVAFFRNGISVEPPAIPAADGATTPLFAVVAQSTQQTAATVDGELQHDASSSTTVPFVQRGAGPSEAGKAHPPTYWLKRLVHERGPLVPAVLLQTAMPAPLSVAATRAMAAQAAASAVGDAVSLTVDFGGAPLKSVSGLPRTFVSFEEAASRM